MYAGGGSVITNTTNDADHPRGIGEFRIVRRLPASSRDVYLAEDAQGERVVLQVLEAPARNQGLFDPELADEASAYARLAHPNIVRVRDVFSAEGRFVVALDYVDGTTLALARAALERRGCVVPDACWVYVMACVFAALAEAHAAKDVEGKPAPVLHRGVNPSNVLVGWDGSVRLGSFQVAQSARVLRDSNPGVTWGSYGYFAPEQVRGEPPAPCTDVYSATLLLWELLAGRKAIERGSRPDAELLVAMAQPDLASLDTLRHDLATPVRYAVRAGLEPQRARRVIPASRIRDVLRVAAPEDANRAKWVRLLALVRDSVGVEVASVPPPKEAAPDPLPGPVVAPMPVHVLVAEPAPPQPAPPPAPTPSPEVAPAPASPAFVPQAPATPPGVAFEIVTAARTLASPAPPTTRGLSRRARFFAATVAVWAAAAAVFTVALVRPPRSRAAARPPPTDARTPTLPLAPTPTLAPTLPPAPTLLLAPTLPRGRGELDLPARATGHRIYVDRRVVGEGAEPVQIACGRHLLRIGSQGKWHAVDVPCGGVLTVP